jgi:D-glycero-D-manno-heptose 1,7-bisphosphate phosphatase
MPAGGHKAVFLDRDGVLNIDLGYTYRSKDLKLVKGVTEGLKELLSLGFKLVVVTNQSGVARGLFSLADVDRFHEELIRQIQIEIPGFTFDAIMICPHHPDGCVSEFSIRCDCRKPGIKLISDAARDLNIDLDQSWLIGDKDSDIECAITAGLRGIQVTKGGKQYPQSKRAFALTETLKEAADLIKHELL